MTKEQKIDMLVAMLAPLIFEDRNEEDDSAPRIIFLSATEVQIEESPGTRLPVNKEYTDNPLPRLLENITNYTQGDERSNWEECCRDEVDDEDVERDLENVYYPELCTDHIYHTIHQLQELLAENKSSGLVNPTPMKLQFRFRTTDNSEWRDFPEIPTVDNYTTDFPIEFMCSYHGSDIVAWEGDMHRFVLGEISLQEFKEYGHEFNTQWQANDEMKRLQQIIINESMEDFFTDFIAGKIEFRRIPQTT